MPNRYTTEQGDTWDLIAKRVYGEHNRAEFFMHVLLEANQEHRFVTLFSANVELTVPTIEPPTMQLPKPLWQTRAL